MKFKELATGKVKADYKNSDYETQAAILKEQVQGINNSLTMAHIKRGGDPSFIPNLLNLNYVLAQLINRMGRFYGLRSKYDGRGVERQPMVA